jgi:hypothetical protein
VVAVAANPDDWRQIYALDAQGRVWFSGDGAQADLGTWNWSQLTANLLALPGAKTLQRIAVEQVGATRVVVVGGEGGVFRRVANGNWVEYGAGIPNAMVTTVDRITGADDVALVGTLGRGAWVLPNASQTLSQPAVLTLRGTGGNDVIQLERNAAQPALLDVFQYLDGQAKPANASLSVPLASIESIVVDGLGGNDRIVVDAVRGAIGVAGGITVAGGLGTDQIELRRTPAAGVLVTNDNGVVAGAAAGSGSHQITVVDALGQSGVQKVSWTGIETPTETVTVAQTIEAIAAGLHGPGGVAAGRARTSARWCQPRRSGRPVAGRGTERAAGGCACVRRTCRSSLCRRWGAPVTVQIDNATSLLLRIFEAGGLDLGQVGAGGSIATASRAAAGAGQPGCGRGQRHAQHR